ncbi:hypothetical protein ICW40_18335 [Actinotalea ferrariae]|uniref:hypothetical protein n=1 Tax=Actinotalea ferrariae TaxID=1386098 RepID=UPI001C8CBB42|nr:hypothetical protein [Actinotalea ferrariae]MBX9246752.1 hypothetical protein [Actinotalea ferrariae]
MSSFRRPNLREDPDLAKRMRRILGDASQAACRELASVGVTGTYPFLGYNLQPNVWWIVATDAERSAMRRDGVPREVVRGHLLAAGMPENLVAGLSVDVESQETVDRNFDGNWWSAMR